MESYLYKEQLLQRGWTEKAIKTYLGEPTNNRWNAKNVLAIERKPAWQQWKNKRELLTLVDQSRITITPQSLEAISYAAVNSYNHLHENEPNFHFAQVTSPPDFLNRIMVNYIRHQETNYDATLKLLSKKVGKAQAYALLKNKVLGIIAHQYPPLAEECIKQRVSIQDVLRDCLQYSTKSR